MGKFLTSVTVTVLNAADCTVPPMRPLPASPGQRDLKTYKSSADHDRVFCAECGSNILVALEDEPDDFYVSMGSVNGNPSLPPGYHIYAGSKAPWHEINDDLPQYDAEPPV